MTRIVISVYLQPAFMQEFLSGRLTGVVDPRSSHVSGQTPYKERLIAFFSFFCQGTLAGSRCKPRSASRARFSQRFTMRTPARAPPGSAQLLAQDENAAQRRRSRDPIRATDC